MLLNSIILLAQLAAAGRAIQPTLAFPEAGLDDSAAYQGYQTRLFRDAARNTIQIYLDRRQGRVVHLLANAENESIGLSARTSDGAGVPLRWGGSGASASSIGRRRTLQYALLADAPRVVLGGFLLGSMRVERDYQAEGWNRRAFAERYVLPELARLLTAIQEVPAEVRLQHLAVLGAPDVAALQRRLRPTVTEMRAGRQVITRVVQPSLDGRDTLTLTVRRDGARVRGGLAGDSVVLEAVAGASVRFEIQIATTGASLSPLTRREIFTPEFLAFVEAARNSAADRGARTRARWMERQVRGVELLASRQKLMAGLPTYATYFGRDMLVTALMMRGIWRHEMAAFAIASALGKLSPTGQVSHEEALGGQAVREAASEYVALVNADVAARLRGEGRPSDTLLARATEVLRHHRRVRENYHMIDDELQLPVLVAWWLGHPEVAASRKRAFLRDATDSGEPRLNRLLRELALVARMTAPYAAAPDAATLISFAGRDRSGWASTSWRDSNAGYAGGRYAMDVNAIWAPHALQATRQILATVRTLGFSLDSLARVVPEALAPTTPLGAWARDSVALQSAINRWLGAGRHFVVRLAPADVQAHVTARLAAMPEPERSYWRGVLTATRADQDSLVFLALALDTNGAPLGVVNTDVATRLFLGDPILGAMDQSVVLRDVRQFTRAYPVGLFIERVGPVVSNDAFAPAGVWADFVRDPYHGPRVAWGREVNLFLLGVAHQVQATLPRGAATPRQADTAFVRELRAHAERVTAAVEASGFQSELWSYDFIGGVPTPIRYGSGADVQLWSTTDLAVQYALSRLRW